MCQILRWGSRIKWSTAASDGGIVEVNSTSDGPQRKTTEESESLKYCDGRIRRSTSTMRTWRADTGNAEMIEAMAGRTSCGMLEFLHAQGIEIEIVFKCGEKNRSA